MKNYYIILTLFILLQAQLIHGQSIVDTKEFIVENFEQNTLKDFDNSAMFFSTNILKKDAETFANQTLSDDAFENILIWGYDVAGIVSMWEVIDIRDINKVSTVSAAGGQYVISIYVSNKFSSLRGTKNLNNPNQPVKFNENIDRMKIVIADNSEVADKIKKAIIHLGKTKGIQIKDGNLF
ncbi:hypothetical protein [Roseivirga spongicola]|uniref:hypothetical protein n=1 Tax=Roseivirga spongicola TaxID=333140 RepID=UPI002AC8C6FC|nr:hypothetical protein [Roseivirga spongicola]WPZ08705.1 hypothetical protein T7867_10595 [Roseivirga spongicola]